MKLITPAVLSFAILVGGCLTPTEVNVVIKSHDLACATPSTFVFGGLDIVATKDDAGLTGASLSAQSNVCNAGKTAVDLGNLVLTPLGSDNRAEVLIVAGVTVTGDGGKVVGDRDTCLDTYRRFLASGAPDDYCAQNDCTSCIVARRGVGFVSHEKLELDVDLSAECAGIFCPGGETCGPGGKCVSSQTACMGTDCNIGQGGSGGATSSSSTSSTGGSGGSGGAPPCDATSGQPTIGFTGLANGPTQVNDIWGDGLGSLWVASNNGLIKCSSSTCTTMVSLDGTSSFLAVSGSGTTIVGLMTPEGIVQSTGGMTFTHPNVACPGQLPSKIAFDGTSVFFSSVVNALGAIWKPEDACIAINSTFAGETRAPMWAFPANPVGADVWAVSGPTLVHYTGSETAMQPYGTLKDLWGFSSPTNADVILACGSIGIYRAVASSTNVADGTPFTHESCTAISGLLRCDGIADVWTLEGGDLVGRRISDTTIGATAPLSKSVGTSYSRIFVDTQSIWIAGPTGVMRSPRPNLK